jgi:hypothetical protein
MTTVLKNNYVTVECDLALSSSFLTWTTETEYMTDEEFREIQIIYNNCNVDYKLQRTLLDTHDLRFLICVETQQWLAENLYPRAIVAGMRRVAVVVSEELIAQLSVEQAIQEDKTDAFQTQYFDDREEAKEWLFADVK